MFGVAIMNHFLHSSILLSKFYRGISGCCPNMVSLSRMRHNLPHLCRDKIPRSACLLPHLCQGVLQLMFSHLASWPVMFRERSTSCQARWRGSWSLCMGSFRREHQEVSDVQRADRKRCRMCTDDVQEMQACLLLVLSLLSWCQFVFLYHLFLYPSTP